MLKFANFYFFEYNIDEYLIINSFVVKNFLKTLFHGEDKAVIANDWNHFSEYETSVENLGIIQENQHESKISKMKKNFEKKFSIRLTAERKQKLAESIVENAHVWRLYWIQLIVACMLATLWLLMNSIPVVIWSMLVSPIMTPIQTFAFAVINWKKHMYINSLKVLLLSILVAVPSSFLICYVIPFSWITEQVLLRATPTVVDWIVAILSWIIAFIFLSDEKLETSIVWIAIAVSLMPPLAAVWIWLHFMNWSVAQWSFLLFITNLVWILVVGILIFYLFWFRATSKDWKKRTNVTIIMLIVFVWLITVPLWKSMTQIAETQKINSLITQVSNDYLGTLNEGIVINELSFRNVSEDTVRIISKLDVPAEFPFTNSYKEELTKRLSESLWKSVELDLDIVEISSAYIEKWESPEKILLDKINQYLVPNNVILVDGKNLLSSSNFLFLSLYSDLYVDKENIKNGISNIVESEYPWARLVLQRQDNLQKQNEEIVERSQAEIDLEKQFSLLFRWWEISLFDLEYLERVQNEEYEKYAQLTIEFMTPYSAYRTKQLLSERKELVKEYLGMDVVLKVKFEEINLMEI